MADYADLLADKVFSPREYVEHQLNMTDEEKETRQQFFTEMFARYNEEKAQREHVSQA